LKNDTLTDSEARGMSGINKNNWWAYVAGILFVAMLTLGLGKEMDPQARVKKAVEAAAMHTLGVPVTVGGVIVDPKAKTMDFSSVRIGNPAGYNGQPGQPQPWLVTVDRIEAVADRIDGNDISFSRITATGANVYLQVQANGTNLTALRKSMDRAASIQQPGGRTPGKLAIKTMLIGPITVTPTVTQAEGGLRPVAFQTVEIDNLGTGQTGIVASEAIGETIDRLTKAVMGAADNAGFLEGMNPDSARALRDELGIKTGLIDQAKQGIENMTQSLKNFFNKD
jgi:hypothetical protein